MSQSEKPPFDGFDDVAEQVTPPHEHPVIPDSYKSGTGFRMMFAAIVLAVVLGGAFLFISGIKAQDEAQLAAATEAKANQPPLVEVITVTAAPPSQQLTLPGRLAGGTRLPYSRVSAAISRSGSPISATGSKSIRPWRRSILQSSMPSSKPPKRSSRLPKPK